MSVEREREITCNKNMQKCNETCIISGWSLNDVHAFMNIVKTPPTNYTSLVTVPKATPTHSEALTLT